MISDLSKIPSGDDPMTSLENGGPPRAAAPTAEQERTTAIIGAEIRTLSVQCNTMRVQYAIEIGRRLCEAKELCKHGEWLDFLKNETEYSQPKASRLMQIFKGFAADQGNLFGAEPKYSTLNNLSVSNALRLLELPEEEWESFAKEVDAEHLSARDLEALVKERTAEIEAKARKWEEQAGEYASQINDLQNDVQDALKQRNDEEQARAEAEEQLRRIKAELDEIEKRPQATVYVPDEEAIAEEVEAALQIERENAEKEKNRAIKDAVQAEREELEKERGKLKSKIAELEEQAKKNAENLRTAHDDIRKAKADAQDAREAVQKAQQAEAEAERLRGDIEALRKQLSMAAPEVAEFKAAFERVQREFSAMLETLDRIHDGETKGKLRAACAAVLDGFMGRVKG